MKYPNDLIPILKVILVGEGSQKQLGELIGLKDTMISGIKFSREPIPADRREALVQLLQERFPSANFTSADLDLGKKAFVERFPKDKIDYARICTIAGIKTEREDSSRIFTAVQKLSLCQGTFFGCYLCTDPDDMEKTVVALDYFQIKQGPTEYELLVHQPSYEHESYDATGRLRICDGTIEIVMDYGNVQHPGGFFIGHVPRGDKINHFLTMTLNITWVTRDVIARPMIFIRKDFFKNEGTYSAKSPLYKAAKQLFDRNVEWSSSKRQLMTKNEVAPVDVAALTAIINQLARGAPAKSTTASPASL